MKTLDLPDCFKEFTLEVGSPTHAKYTFSAEYVGKTVEARGVASVEAAYGDEPCTVVLFTDGTCHGFVHPVDDDE